jgi:hypothetical protein
MNEDRATAPADQSYLNMQNNLKSLQSKIMDLENKLNRVNVEDTGNSMTISGMEHSSIMAGPGSNPNLIRDIQIPQGHHQQMPTPILKNKENHVPPLSPSQPFSYKDHENYDPRGL